MFTAAKDFFFHGKKSNVAKHSVTYGILLQSNVDIQSQLIFAEF